MGEKRQLSRRRDYTIGDKVLNEPVICPVRGPKMSCVALCAFYTETILPPNLNHGKKRIVHCNFTDKDIGEI